MMQLSRAASVARAASKWRSFKSNSRRESDALEGAEDGLGAWPTGPIHAAQHADRTCCRGECTLSAFWMSWAAPLLYWGVLRNARPLARSSPPRMHGHAPPVSCRHGPQHSLA